jgi:hypothetical protein
MITMEQLRNKVSTYRSVLGAKDGRVIYGTSYGPVDMEVVDILIEAMKDLDERISKLEAGLSRQVSTHP